MLRQCHTAVIERNVLWEGDWATEPYEAAWAVEAIAFLRVLERRNIDLPVTLWVQISPDGIHWCDEGSALVIPPHGDVAFVKLSHFGGWLRLAGTLDENQGMKVVLYLNLKG